MLRKKKSLFALIALGMIYMIFILTRSTTPQNVESSIKLNTNIESSSKASHQPSRNYSKEKKKRITINPENHLQSQEDTPTLPPFLKDKTLKAAYIKRIHKSIRVQFEDFFIENPDVKNKEEVMDIRLSYEDWVTQASIDLLHSSLEERKKAILQENANLELRFKQALGSHYSALKDYKKSLPIRAFVRQLHERYATLKKPIDSSLKKELITALIKNQNSIKTSVAANLQTIKQFKGRLTDSQLYYVLHNYLEQPRPIEDDSHDIW